MVVELWHVHAIYNTILGFMVGTPCHQGASVQMFYCIAFLFDAPLGARMTIFVGRGWFGRGSNGLGALS